VCIIGLGRSAGLKQPAGLMINNFENYFWGIDFDKYDKIILHIEVTSKDDKYMYEYDQYIY
jgi:hypothetical protein